MELVTQSVSQPVSYSVITGKGEHLKPRCWWRCWWIM